MKKCHVWLGICCTIVSLPVFAQTPPESPVLQRWLNQPPDLLQDIQEFPTFPSKVRLGLTSRNNNLGWSVGVEDIFVGKTNITLSGGYQRQFEGAANEAYFGNLRYYLFPLGSYVNIAPQVGYRQLLGSSGVDVGFQVLFAFSPQSADIRLEQVFTAPGQTDEARLTSLSASYALTRNLLIHSGIEWQQSTNRSESVARLALEWKLPILGR